MTSSPFTLTVASRFTRAVHLVRDAHRAEDGLQGYQVTPLVLTTLGQVLAGLAPDSRERAFSVIGPYGAGKSAFGVFLAAYLRATPRQRRQLIQSHRIPVLDERLIHTQPQLLPVLVSGNNSALRPAIRAALIEALEHEPLLDPLVQQLRALPIDADPQQLTALVAETAQTLAQVRIASGIVIMIDELGQYLNYTAQHGDERDLFVLQTLAEMASRSGDTPCLIVTFLHQAFDRYTITAGATQRNEWAKVQGRYRELPFQESATQMIRMVSHALCPAPKQVRTVQRDWGISQAEIADTLGLRPADMTRDEWTHLVIRAYPLHPTVLVTLPVLFRQLAQNERSLFAFLASHEPWSVHDVVAQATDTPIIYRLPHLYRYSMTNFGASLMGRARGLRWAELDAVLTQVSDLSALPCDVLTVIGMLGALGDNRQQRANLSQLSYALTDTADDEQVAIALNLLVEQRHILYRTYRDRYVLWEGSDLDLDTLMAQTRVELAGQRSLGDLLRAHMPLLPLIARRTSYQSGAVRQFVPQVVDAQELDTLQPAPATTGTVSYVVGADAEELAVARIWAQEAARAATPLHMIVIPQRIQDVRAVLLDVAALQHIQAHEPALAHDRAGRREVAARLSEAQQAIDEIVAQVYGVGASDWYWRGQSQPLRSARALDNLLSRACDMAFPAAPRLWNELVMRDTLSSAAAKARRLLIERMLNQHTQPELGMTGNPPERTIYASVYAAGGIHAKQADGTWAFGRPHDPDPLHLQPTWDAMEEQLCVSQESAQPLLTLYAIIEAPPYGIKRGLTPLLFVALYLAHADEIALYEHSNFVPLPDIAMFERLLRNPGHFAFRHSVLRGMRVLVFEHLTQAFIPGIPAQVSQSAILSAVGPLLRVVHSLPTYTRITMQISVQAQQIRAAILTARAPDELLFDALPRACKVSPFAADTPIDATHTESFFARLRRGLTEIQQAYPALIAHVGEQLRCAFGADPMPLEALRAALVLRYARIAHRVTDPQLRALGVRWEHSAPGTAWIETSAALLMHKPLDQWNDADVAGFAIQATAVGRHLQVIEDLAFVTERTPPEKPILRIGIADYQGERSMVVERPTGALAERIRDQIQQVLAAAQLSVAEQTAVLAELLEHHLMAGAPEREPNDQ